MDCDRSHESGPSIRRSEKKRDLGWGDPRSLIMGLLPVAKALALPGGRHRLPKGPNRGEGPKGLHIGSSCRDRWPDSEITYSLAGIS